MDWLSYQLARSSIPEEGMMMRIQLMIGVVAIAMLDIALTGVHGQLGNAAAPANSGTIAGRVLSPEGQPVPGATVFVSRPELVLGKLPSSHTNSLGAFRIKGLAPGTYSVNASKEEDGYAPTDSAFHALGPVRALEVTVYAQQPTPELVIQLGPKLARLVGRVVDAKKNEPVVNAQITLTRVDDSDHAYSTGPNAKAEFDVLVPPVPFTITVTAAGYKDWHFRHEGPKKPVDKLELPPNTTKEMNI